MAAAQRAVPAALRATPAAETSIGEAPPKKAARVLKLRARATARYAAEVVDWPHQLAELLDKTAQILAPTLAMAGPLAIQSNINARPGLASGEVLARPDAAS